MPHRGTAEGCESKGLREYLTPSGNQPVDEDPSQAGCPASGAWAQGEVLRAPCRGRGVRRRLTSLGLVRKALVLLHTQGPTRPGWLLALFLPRAGLGDGSDPAQHDRVQVFLQHDVY